MTLAPTVPPADLEPAAAAPGALSVPAAEVTLDPDDWQALRALGHRMLDDTLDRLEHVRSRPLWRAVPDDVRAEFHRPLPRAGAGIENAYADFRELVAPYPLGNTHPRFWGWVTGGGSPFGALADLLATGDNATVSGLASAQVHVEEQVLDWLKELLAFPAGGSGLLASGCSMANVIGLAVGLLANAGFDLAEEGMAGAARRPILYASRETHSSVDKAARLLGLGRAGLRKIGVGADYRIDLGELAATIARDREAGHHPCLLVGTAGTVNTGAFDDLEALADLAARERLWFHVDGAFGALAAAVPELAARTAGMARADSLAFDLHKWLHVPIEAACLLVRDPEAHRRAFTVPASYLSELERGVAAYTHRFSDLGPQLTRGARALKIWMTLSAYGADRHAAVVAQNVRQAQALERRIGARPELELLAPTTLNIVCFRYRGGAADERLDGLNRELLMRLQERGLAVPSSTVLGGRFALRVCIANHRTREADLELFVASVLELGRELEGEAA
ncbi:MAG: pyridoxal-dependent decarboxylase [Thermoanaerobaculia bacterium]